MGWVTDGRIRTEACAELDGVVVRSDQVRVEIGDIRWVLRPTKLEDIEQEFKVHGPHEDYLTPPSAILRVSTNELANETSNRVRQAIGGPRLFGIGSVSYRSIRSQGCAFADFFASGRLWVQKTHSQQFKYVINDELATRLVLFWKDLLNCVPSRCFRLRLKNGKLLGNSL